MVCSYCGSKGSDVDSLQHSAAKCRDMLVQLVERERDASEKANTERSREIYCADKQLLEARSMLAAAEKRVDEAEKLVGAATLWVYGDEEGDNYCVLKVRAGKPDARFEVINARDIDTRLLADSRSFQSRDEAIAAARRLASGKGEGE